MKNWRQLLGDERGNALALALIIMVIMTALAIGLATMGGVESRISASQSAGARARLLAESGLEYATLFVAPKDVMVWDQKVMVEDGRPTELVLTPATALVPPDKFPPPPSS